MGDIYLRYIPRNMHTVTALLCFVLVIHWLIFPYPSGLLLWHCGNLTIAPVPAKQPWWIWINTSCEYIMNDCITTTKQSTDQKHVHISWDILYKDSNVEDVKSIKQWNLYHVNRSFASEMFKLNLQYNYNHNMKNQCLSQDQIAIPMLN